MRIYAESVERFFDMVERSFELLTEGSLDLAMETHFSLENSLTQ